MPANLKPCPFLVEKDFGHDLRINLGDGLPFVECSCGASGPISACRDNAIDNWNTRAYINEENFNDLTTQVKTPVSPTPDGEICQNIVDAVFEYIYNEMTIEMLLRKGSLDRLKEIVAGKLLLT